MNRNYSNQNRQSRFNQPLPNSSMESDHLQTPVQYPSLNLYNQRHEPTTPEQFAFEVEFKKWQTGFEDWKKAYANHPDRTAYYQYEKKFLDVREKLVQKRSQIYNQRSLKQQLDSQLVAASLMAESILSKFSELSEPSFNNMSDAPRTSSYNMNDSYRVRSRSPMNRERFQNNPQNQLRNNPQNQFRNDSQNQFRNNQAESYRNRTPPQEQRRQFDRSRPSMNNAQMQDNSFQRNPQMNQNFTRNLGGNKLAFGSNKKQPMTGRDAPGKSEANLRRELNRKDVYPNVPWRRSQLEQRPPLVGKRRKKKTAKILRLLEKPANAATGSKSIQSLIKKIDQALNGECPKRMSGAGRRKYAILKNQKPKDDWTEQEKTFMELADLAKSSRGKSFSTGAQQVPPVKITPESSLEPDVVNETSVNAAIDVDMKS